MNYAREIKKLKTQDIAPSNNLWCRIEDTLVRKKQRVVYFTKYRLAASATALAVCAVVIFSGTNYYDHYQLDKYLAQSFDYTSYSSQVYDSWGTFI